MEDLRTNKTELYVIIENTYTDGYEEMQTYIFDDEQVAKNKFEELIANDKEFLKEEERDDIVERDGYWYQSYPEGDYAESHYTLDLLTTKHNA